MSFPIELRVACQISLFKTQTNMTTVQEKQCKSSAQDHNCILFLRVIRPGGFVFLPQCHLSKANSNLHEMRWARKISVGRAMLQLKFWSMNQIITMRKHNLRSAESSSLRVVMYSSDYLSLSLVRTKRASK